MCASEKNLYNPSRKATDGRQRAHLRASELLNKNIKNKILGEEVEAAAAAAEWVASFQPVAARSCLYYSLFFLLNSLSPTHTFIPFLASSFLLCNYTLPTVLVLSIQKKSRERERLLFTRRNRQPLGLCSFTSSCCHEKKTFTAEHILHHMRYCTQIEGNGEDDQVRVCVCVYNIPSR